MWIPLCVVGALFNPDNHPEPLRSQMKNKPGEFHSIYGVICHKDDHAAIARAEAAFADRCKPRTTETI